jgi:hypothetical protein|tara:strand:- start:3904 stop:4155 length:252 start_codon:yes stop_codon:yes gene_type:complete
LPKPHGPPLSGLFYGADTVSYTIDKSLKCLQEKVQRAIQEFHEESGHMYSVGVDVNNMQVNTIGERVSKYTSIVSVSAEIQTS